ncbi:MAG: carboxypeptidase regulatory-like domain-containing protein [Ruminococcaceae bacterium]|nr:carboxypeptidase regulatory-like domain-containing protein [Oscillospiraceae bacterium]
MENPESSQNQELIPYIGEGYLIMNVSSASGALPIKDARVHIKGADIQNRDTEYSLNTNESGRSERIALKAPSRSLSLSPGNPYGFARYTAVVTKDGYYTQTFEGLPVFDGITSIQPVLLVPLAPYNSGDFDPANEQRLNETGSAKQ